MRMIKFKWKRYIFLSLLSTSIFMAFSKGLFDIYGNLVGLAATFLNQYLLIRGVEEFVFSAKSQSLSQKRKKQALRKVLIFSVLKFFVLFVGFYLSYKLMGKSVILPILNYVLLIFILVFSIESFEDSPS